MKIALLMENSQAGKKPVVLNELNTVTKPLGHEVFNVVMESGNALAIAFAKGFGWGAELNLKYMFENCQDQAITDYVKSILAG